MCPGIHTCVFMFSNVCTCLSLSVCACRSDSRCHYSPQTRLSPLVSDVSAPCRPCCSPSHCFSLLSGNLFTHKTSTLLHMYVFVCLCVFVTVLFCVCERVCQPDKWKVKYLWLLSPPPSSLLPDRNKLVPDVLLTITPRTFLTLPLFLCLFILHFLI